MFVKYDKILGQYYLLRSAFIKSKSTRIKYHLHKTQAKKCFILLNGWQMPLIESFILEKRLKKDNYLVMELPDSTISKNPYLTVRIMNKANKLLHKKISEFKKRGVKEFVLVAASLGGVPGTIILNQERLLKKGIFISPSNSVSNAFWEGMETQIIKKALKEKGYTKQKLSDVWHDIQPENNMKHFANKKIVVHISQSDLVIPYEGGLKFVKEAKNNGAKVKTIKHKNTGHILNIVENYTLGKLS